MSSETDSAAKRKRARRILAVAVVLEAGGLWLRTGRLGGNVVVRCRDGHLFTTLWLPAVSVKALRLRALAGSALPGRRALGPRHAGARVRAQLR